MIWPWGSRVLWRLSMRCINSSIVPNPQRPFACMSSKEHLELLLADQGQEEVHILIAELIAAAVMMWMAIEAVYHENAFELLASAIVACAVSARIIYFMVSLRQGTKAWKSCSLIFPDQDRGIWSLSAHYCFMPCAGSLSLWDVRT